MHKRIPTDEEILEQTLHDTYEAHCPQMNRKERRTMKGKLLIAEAKLKVAEAELEHYKQFGLVRMS
jgi:hypothetical protein